METLRQNSHGDGLWRVLGRCLIVSAALLMLACTGESGEDPTPQNPGSQQTRVSGLAVLHQHTPTSGGDALGVPPLSWEPAADMTSFDRALAHADWQIQGNETLRGTTGPDGRFTIDQLAPGSHMLQVTKTLNGNPVSLSLPLTVGDQGARVLIELSWGAIRTVSTYTQQGDPMQELRGPGGNRLVTRHGHIRELSDGSRTFIDANGDGSFEDCVSSERGTACVPADIVALIVYGVSPVIRGQPTWISASAQLSDDSEMDVTHLVAWQSSDAAVAQVNSWGEVTTLALGTTQITATLGKRSSDAWAFAVVPRPPLTRIYLENVGCFSILPVGVADAVATDRPVVRPTAVVDDSLLWAPTCAQVVQVGGTLQFAAIGVFGSAAEVSIGEYYEDITDEVTWELVPSEVGEVVAGLFTARQVGTAQLRAALEAVQSEPMSVQVVAEPTVVALSIYPAYSGGGGIGVVFPVAEKSGRLADIAPCDDCAEYTFPVLRGDSVNFFATAYYDTGQWREVTDEVLWRSTAPAIAPIDTHGVMTAQTAGRAVIDATFAAVTSNQVTVEVVNEATLESLWIYQEGDERVLGKGGEAFFRAHGYYDIGLDKDLTTQATWQSSDQRIGGFDTPGVFTGRAAGTVEVWAQVDGLDSDLLTIEVFETSDLPYCDAAQVNRGVWSDEFNRVVLESDCAEYEYASSDVVTLRYTVTALQPRFGIFDPCLDLYVYQGDTRVRTIREEGCGEPFLPTAAADFAAEQLKYQWRASWDRKTDQGKSVEPGVYTIYGRFYLYYDPVVQIDITIQ